MASTIDDRGQDATFLRSIPAVRTFVVWFFHKAVSASLGRHLAAFGN
jgi:hypothetical protein